MSTLYGIGAHRLVYKAGAFATGKTVTAYVWSPTLVRSDLQTFTEVSDGLYYLDYTFGVVGTHFCKLYEDDVATTVGTYRIEAKTGYALAATGLDAITATAPGGVATTFPQMLVQLWRRFFKKAAKTPTTIVTYADDGTTPETTQAITDDGAGTESQGAAT